MFACEHRSLDNSKTIGQSESQSFGAYLINLPGNSYSITIVVALLGVDMKPLSGGIQDEDRPCQTMLPLYAVASAESRNLSLSQIQWYGNERVKGYLQVGHHPEIDSEAVWWSLGPYCVAPEHIFKVSIGDPLQRR